MGRSARIAIIALLFLLAAVLSIQGIGVSVSYFLPRNGMFSHPVTPLSLRDIEFDIGRFLGVGGSLSLYSMRGMGITDAEGNPIASDGPLVGPFLSVLSSAVAKLKLPIPPLEFEASGGVFGCYNIDPPLMTGNLDRYLASATGTTYEAVTSTISLDGRWGWGWVFGGSATYFLKGQFGISVGANYYLGGGNLELSGSYDAYDDGSGWVTGQDIPAILKTARLDFSGLEIILGVELEL
ncbi:MAG: hypothetical protein JSV89_15045 [Spirochaetaceae bacterium]|nr:MAG: hypothetical protein JSV89_15045 [Spirochaetaceae bacterium]